MDILVVGEAIDAFRYRDWALQARAVDTAIEVNIRNRRGGARVRQGG